MSTLATEKTYHHGDLRSALVTVGLAILAEGGPTALSLREVARRAGVSAMAPYRHFVDKAALLAAIAEVGFERLTAAQLAADAHHDASEALVGQGVAYVDFACENPALFRLMFGAGGAERTGELARVGRRSFDVLARRVAGMVPPADVETTTLLCWAQAHGLASLAVDGQLGDKAELPRALAARVLHRVRLGA